MRKLGPIGLALVGVGVGIPIWALIDQSGYLRRTDAIDGRQLLAFSSAIGALGFWLFWHRHPSADRRHSSADRGRQLSRSSRQLRWWIACICVAAFGAVAFYRAHHHAASPTSAVPSQSSPAGQLAAVDGSASASAFKRVMDCITTADPRLTEQEIAHEMVGSWKVNGRVGSLWSYTKGFSILYNC